MANSDQRSRNSLKSRFVKNAIPTEQDFRDLIDASLNQADDGVWKKPSEPLSLCAVDDGTALQLYTHSAAAQPAWKISLQGGLAVSNQSAPRLVLAEDGTVIVAGLLRTANLVVTETLHAKSLVTSELTPPALDGPFPKLTLDMNQSRGNTYGLRLHVGVHQAPAQPKGAGFGLTEDATLKLSAEGSCPIVLENPHVGWLPELQASLRFLGPDTEKINWDMGLRANGELTFRTDAAGYPTRAVFGVRSEGAYARNKLMVLAPDTEAGHSLTVTDPATLLVERSEGYVGREAPVMCVKGGFEADSLALKTSVTLAGNSLSPPTTALNARGGMIEVMDGDLVIKLPNSYWVFQSTGDLVHYSSVGGLLWRSTPS